MQALCQWDVQGEESADVLENFFAALAPPSSLLVNKGGEDRPLSPHTNGGGGETADYARELVTAFWRQRASVDQRIAAASPKWDLDRMSVVERNTLRVAAVEMLDGQTPPRVALDEAIEIVKEYGGADSPRFVNGVLDQVYRGIQSAAGKA